MEFRFCACLHDHDFYLQGEKLLNKQINHQVGRESNFVATLYPINYIYELFMEKRFLVIINGETLSFNVVV